MQMNGYSKPFLTRMLNSLPECHLNIYHHDFRIPRACRTLCLDCCSAKFPYSSLSPFPLFDICTTLYNANRVHVSFHFHEPSNERQSLQHQLLCCAIYKSMSNHYLTHPHLKQIQITAPSHSAQ